MSRPFATTLAALFLATVPVRAQSSGGFLTTRDGARLFYSATGSGSDTVIVLADFLFVQRWASLGEDHVIVFYDPRSRGRSDPVSDSTKLGFNLEVDDIDRVRERVGASRIALVGFSYLGGSREWAAVIQNSRVLVFPQTGHYMFVERPVEILTALRTFLGGAWPVAAR